MLLYNYFGLILNFFFFFLSTDLAIYVPMDVITGTTTPAVGFTVTVAGTPAPYVTAGKLGNAINLGNLAPTDGKYLDLGQQTSRCADNLGICNKGWTLAFWYKTSATPVGDVAVVQGSFFAVWHLTGMRLTTAHHPYSDSNRTNIPVNEPLSYGHWHHVVLAYNGVGLGFCSIRTT